MKILPKYRQKQDDPRNLSLNFHQHNIQHIQRKNRLEEAFKIYKEQYEKYYDDDLRKFIESRFFIDAYEKESVDVLMQLYSELGLDQGIETFYKTHFQKINNLFGLDRDVIEVGSGYIPAFANKIAFYQQRLQKGTITIYEPLLNEITPKFPNMTIHKEKFTPETQINSNALGISILSCEATATILKKFCENRMDFYIAMCGCDHTSNGFTYNPYFYQESIIALANNLVKDYDNGELVVDSLGKEFNIDYPILYNRRR